MTESRDKETCSWSTFAGYNITLLFRQRTANGSVVRGQLKVEKKQEPYRVCHIVLSIAFFYKYVQSRCREMLSMFLNTLQPKISRISKRGWSIRMSITFECSRNKILRLNLNKIAFNTWNYTTRGTYLMSEVCQTGFNQLSVRGHIWVNPDKATEVWIMRNDPTNTHRCMETAMLSQFQSILTAKLIELQSWDWSQMKEKRKFFKMV